MLARIISGYISIIGNTVRILLLFTLCLICGALVVYPLWRLASENPSTYTLLFSILASAVTGFLLLSRLRVAYKTDKKRLVLSLSRFATIALGLTLCVLLVLSWHRLAALTVLLITLAGYGLLAFGLKDGDSRKGR